MAIDDCSFPYVQTTPASERAGQGFLVRRCLRQPDAIAPANRSTVPERQQPLVGPQDERRRLGGCVLRSEGARRLENNWVETIPGKGGSCCSVYTVRSNRGSTRLGGLARLSRSDSARSACLLRCAYGRYAYAFVP